MRLFFLTRMKGDVVWICGLSMSHVNLTMAVLFSSIEATLKD